MNSHRLSGFLALALMLGSVELSPVSADDASSERLKLAYEDRFMTISGEALGDESLRIHYLEAYCRAGSTDADWGQHTVIPHEVTRAEVADDGSRVVLRHLLQDGLIVEHEITAGDDAVTFEIFAKNPTDKESEAHWAQPCIRVGGFAGVGPDDTEDKYAYVEKSFIFVDGELTRLPMEPWATEARYIPGQVWRPADVPAADVNPRPLNPVHPSPGIIGCYSADNSKIFATAFEPYQELFQGVIRCLHSDFRLGGLPPGGELRILGKIYVVDADVDALLARYHEDFPHAGEASAE